MSENEESHQYSGTTMDEDKKRTNLLIVQELKLKFSSTNLCRSSTRSPSPVTPPGVSSAPHNGWRRTPSMFLDESLVSPRSRLSFAGPGSSTNWLKQSTKPLTTAIPGSNSENGSGGRPMSENEESHQYSGTTMDDGKSRKQLCVQELKLKFSNLSRSHTISTSPVTPPEVSSAPHNGWRRTPSMFLDNKPVTAPRSRHSLAGLGSSTSWLKPSTPPETTAKPGSNLEKGSGGRPMSENEESHQYSGTTKDDEEKPEKQLIVQELKLKFSTNLCRSSTRSTSPVTPPGVSSAPHQMSSGRPYMFLDNKSIASPSSRYSLAGQGLSIPPVTTATPRNGTPDTVTPEDPDKVPEICLSNLWKHCQLEGRCPDMHYYLPYRWQIYKGTDWEDISNMEEIEKCYCDPSADSVQSIDFVTMRSGVLPLRRLSTVSSVMKPPEYVLSTEWLWYWKDKYGVWTLYGQSNDVINVNSTVSSSDLEKVYLVDPTTVIPFIVSIHFYEMNFLEMKQKNILFKTERDVRRRPKYQSSEDVKLLRGRTKLSAPQAPLKSAPAPLKSAPSPLKSAPSPLKSAPSPLKSVPSTLNTDIYPSTWDTSALPDIGCQKVPVSVTSSEFSEIVGSFTKTVSGHVVKKLWRLQNPSLWQVFHWQKEQMKKINQGQEVKEMRLFHGTDTTHINAICNQNFDWRLCGTHGTLYGQGSYFAQDASYSHSYSSEAPDGTRLMFMARVLVGDFTIGNPQMKRPPLRPGSTTWYYDSCVDNINNPSIFVVFEKHQIYPEYLLEYEVDESRVICQRRTNSRRSKTEMSSRDYMRTHSDFYINN